MHATIHSDGSWSGNMGGYGALIHTPTSYQEIKGGMRCHSSGEAELIAAIKALEALPPGVVTVDIYTDSMYLIQGATEWIEGWVDRGWKTATGEPVKYAELWDDLLTRMAPYEVTYRWVKGHNGDEGNTNADSLASRGRKEFVQSLEDWARQPAPPICPVCLNSPGRVILRGGRKVVRCVACETASNKARNGRR